MGFQQGVILLDSPTGYYFPGQTIRGNVKFYITRQTTCRGIYVKIKGVAEVHLSDSQYAQPMTILDNNSVPTSARVGSQDVNHSKNNTAYEEYFHAKLYILGKENGESLNLEPNSYEIPFKFDLPKNCPSSFKGAHGSVRYSMKCVMDKMFQCDDEIKCAFKVVAPLDLNFIPSAKDPIEIQIEDAYYCSCFGAGSGICESTVRMPASGLVPGQLVPIEVNCCNSSYVDINFIRISVQKTIKYRTNRSAKFELRKIAEMKLGPIPEKETKNWSVLFEIPNEEVTNLQSCKMIVIEYTFQVDVISEGCHGNSTVIRRLYFGTVPLRGIPQLSELSTPPKINNPITKQPERTKKTKAKKCQVEPQYSPYPPNPYPPSPSSNKSTLKNTPAVKSIYSNDSLELGKREWIKSAEKKHVFENPQVNGNHGHLNGNGGNIASDVNVHQIGFDVFTQEPIKSQEEYQKSPIRKKPTIPMLVVQPPTPKVVTPASSPYAPTAPIQSDPDSPVSNDCP